MMPWNKRQWGDQLIVPGERIGGFMLGRQPSDFLPEDSEATIADWSGRCNVGIQLGGERGVIDAVTSDPKYHTAEGFKVGTEFSEVEAAWGPPDEESSFEGGEGYFDRKVVYTRRGIDFAIREGKLLIIAVFLPEPVEQPGQA